MDDINVGLESMHFQQRAGGKVSERRYSPNDYGAGALGQDGAMEIQGRASVYSLDSGFSHGSGAGVPGGREQGMYAGGEEQRRDSHHSASVEGYSEERPHSGASYLPYDDPYAEQRSGTSQQQQQQHFPPQQQQFEYHSPPSTSSGQQQQYYDGGYPQEGCYNGDPRHYPQQHHSNSFGPPPNQQYPQQHQQHPHHHPQQYHPQQGPSPPSFQPQPPHAGYGYDYAAAAAQNPYYAAATGQLGFPDGYGGPPNPYGLHRAISSASSLGSLAPPPSLGQGTMQGGLGRSPTSMTGPGARQKGTSNSSGGPPITKASVDEYRSRIKADPDPEAQFNFAKYLIEAAKKISSSASGDEKSAKKYRDALLAESLKLIKRLATQGVGLGKPAYADAQFFLANCLGNGSLGLQVDHEKAYNLYVQASKQNHSSATYRTAVCNEVGAGTRRDHARAVLFYRKASALGDTAGMYKLGMILLNGLLGQQRNPKEAVAWLKRAAAQADEDNPHALHELGLLYEKAPPPGHPGPLATIIPFDPAQARELFTQAGQFGYPPSQFKLGTCYEYGSLTCPVDPRRSIAWYTRAAERGDAESELALSGWYLTGSEGVLKQSDSEAYLWARRAANKGLPKAEYAVGYYSEVGIGVKQDLEEARRWYMRAAGASFPLSSFVPSTLADASFGAAAQGNKRAMQRLTELKKLGEKGRGGPTKKPATDRPTRQQAEKECVVM